jgi:hypothetical protein
MRPNRPASTAGLQRTRRIAEACLKDRAHAHAGLFGLAQDVIGAFDRRIERLLDHQVLAGADRRQRRLQVQRRRRGDAHRIEARLLQQRCTFSARTRCRARARTSSPSTPAADYADSAAARDAATPARGSSRWRRRR